MKRATGLSLALILVLISSIVFAQDPANFNTSLHKTRAGKAYWYGQANGGFETLTNIPIDTLGCMKCHPATYADGSQVDVATYEPGCNDCHDFVNKGTTVEDAQCLQCHGRQATEINKMHLADVHRDMGFKCTDCHTKKEMHGDGHSYNSLLEAGAMEVQCENCHNDVEPSPSHLIHKDELECSTCHVQTVITCYNCHFESLVEGKVKRAAGGLKGYMLLVRKEDTGKVSPATFMAMTYQGKAFYAVAPFYSHSVQKEGKQCTDCHGSNAVKAIQNGDPIKLATWDDTNHKVLPYNGVVPVTSDWQNIFQFDFLSYSGDVAGDTDPTKWSVLKTNADLSQMLFAQPLTAEDMEKLSSPIADTFPTSL
ncbi:MAG TPA: hypothetical protein ENJ23_02515, partial [Bacteroidetes bacterium]|nr:hypothetical protein [Bacteroidota bacterium]